MTDATDARRRARSSRVPRRRHVLAALAETWVELLPSEAVWTTAERLLAVHALRAADALPDGD